METPLQVLSRAATMVDNSNDTRISNKELPTTKWRRERRIRVSSEYHSPPSPGVKPLSESNSTNSAETPLDMSVPSKPRTPPPPYREPLPGSTFATTLARPSVITQAPKREIISNRENKDTIANESISMIDPVIDEHFRRSLGADYMNLFGNKKSTNLKIISKKISPIPPAKATSPTPAPAVPVPEQVDTIEMSVDDHFAKALGGDTWKQLKDSRSDTSLDGSSVRQCVKN
ncbi:uncharacterized protein LOC119071298 isoform X2 [Bradysia coprophila]|uniref:uncharacterized protein LOC119071298 isoform X2 n=1 Tax=Bradysia coprophila TaxID=38358 RepID=UPI00187DB332|nr:uncharacterized protein LOC119071298 isoform X2 [Bradysia coprophila]XP_037032070.1 uncharacterized protein LOC119071298 isoform X2 [Bradysia coprophila]